jgi:N-methylhydantoinase B
VEMMDDFGLADLEVVGREILEKSRRAMIDEIRSLPPGEYRHAMRIDGYDRPVDLVCTLTISGSGIDLDWSGTSPASAAGINVPLPYTEAYASFGVRCVVGNDVPNNAGSLGAIRVTAPRGCILNAEPPRAVSARHAVGQMLPDVVLGCLAQLVSDRVPAEGASCIWNPVFLNAPPAAGENAPEAQFVTNPIYNGGTGARPGKDGLSTTAFPSGVRTTSTEVNEATTPLLILRKEYRQDSAGPGEHRGGLGQTVEVAHAHGEPFVISKMFDRISHPARGRFGGGDGEPGRVYVKGGDDFRGKGRDVVPPGATLVMETPGGAGMGNVAERDRERIGADLEAGLVSPEAARDVYGFDAAVPGDDDEGPVDV